MMSMYNFFFVDYNSSLLDNLVQGTYKVSLIIVKMNRNKLGLSSNLRQNSP